MTSQKEPKRWLPNLPDRIPRATLVVLRIWIGLTWLRAGWNKLLTEGGWTETLLTSLKRVGEPNRLYEPFLSNVVLPHPEVFASLVSWGEFLTGVSLVLGITSRLGAGVGMFLSINYLFLQNRFFPGYDGTLLVAQFVLLLGASGRVLGADGYLQRRWPGVPLW